MPSVISKIIVLAIISALPSLSWQTLHSTNLQTAMADERETLPGDNTAAYYCRSTPRKDQMFEIEEFTIAPNPPVPEHRFFAFLMGFMPNEPDLNDSSLRFSMIKDGEEIKHVEDKLNTEYIFKRHNRFEYGPEIKPGRMEFLMDYFWLDRNSDPGLYTMKAESKLPDERVLFCIEFSYEYPNPDANSNEEVGVSSASGGTSLER